MSNIPRLDIIIPEVHSPLYLAVGDVSFYPIGFNIVNPSLEVTPPLADKKVLTFVPNNMGVYNSADLGITCVEDECLVSLPDGIWEITYSIAPLNKYNVTKKFLRVFNLVQQFDVAFMNVELMECNQIVKEQNRQALDQIEFYINGAIATANDCNYTKAMELYREASKLLTNFLKTKC